MAITVAMQNTVAAMYAALFNRAAEKSGLDFWCGQLDSGVSLAAMAQTMYETAPARATYPDGISNADVVKAFYLNVLGRAGDAEGLAFWEARLNTLGTKGALIAEMVANVQSYAGTDADGVKSKALFDNKVAVGFAYAVTLGKEDVELAKSVLALVTDTDTAAALSAANVGSTFTLTTGKDTLIGTALNDTVNSAAGTLGDTDIIADQSSTDNDTVNATVTNVALKPVFSKIENLNINGQFATTGIDLANTTGAKVVTASTAITNGTATVIGAKVGATAKIVAGANIATLNVTADSTTGTGGTLAVDAGAATAVAFTAGSAADAVALTVNGNVAVTGGAAVETMTLNATKASVVTLDAIGNALTVTGAGDVTLKTAIANLAGETVVDSLTSGNLIVNATGNAGADLDLSKVQSDTLKFSGTIGANVITVASGVNVALDVDATDTTVATTDGFTASAATAASNTITVNIKSNQAGLDFNNFATVNIVSAATAVTGIDATIAKLATDATTTVNLSGTNDVKVTLGAAKTFDASTLVGKLDYTQTADAATTVKGGSGANVITLKGTTVANTYVGQNGGDNVILATTEGTGTVTSGSGADIITANGLTTGTVNLTLGDGANAVSSSGVIATTGTLNVTSGSGNDSVTANGLTTGTVAGSLGAGDDTVSATGLTSGIVSFDLGAGNDSVTLGTLVTTGTIAITGGDGTDTLKVVNTTDVKGATLSLTGVEVLELTTAGTATFSAAQMTGKTYTLKGSGTTSDTFTVTEVTNEGATIDLANLVLDNTVAHSIAGVNINGGNGVDTITGTSGKDTIVTGTGADKIIFAATAALNNEDTLTGFTAGAGGDVMNFMHFNNAATVAQNTGTGTAIVAYEHNATANTDITNKVVLLAAVDGGNAEVDSAAKVAALIDGTGNVFAITAGGKSIVIAGDDSANTSSALVYFVHDMNGDGLVSSANEVKLVGTIGAFDLDTLTTANFAFA